MNSILPDKKGRISGIYQIINLVNNKIYIGSSCDIRNRFSVHASSLNLARHHNNHLQKSWNKYGEKNFLFLVIFECEKELLIESEQNFIDALQPEYNINQKAESCLGIKRSEETRRRMREGKSKISDDVKRIALERLRIHNETYKKHSEETKAKMKARARRGERNHSYGKPNIRRGVKISVEEKENREIIRECKHGCGYKGNTYQLGGHGSHCPNKKDLLHGEENI